MTNSILIFGIWLIIMIPVAVIVELLDPSADDADPVEKMFD